MSNCTKCCSGKALKLSSRKNSDGTFSAYTKRCPGDGSDANADLCAAVQAAIACAPRNLSESTAGSVKILNVADSQAAIAQEVRAQTGCPGKLVLEGCIRASTGKSGCVGINTSKRADGTEVDLQDALAAANCNLEKAVVEALVAGKTGLPARTCHGCKND